MFEKLLSVLPYNPSLVQQLSFYGKRMRHEAVVRRTGVMFLLLAFFVQFFAFVSPPQPTVANSSNDIINGGITSVADAVAKCNQDTQTFQQILAAYGITCDDLARSSKVSLNSTSHNKELFSMGRLPYGQKNARTGKATRETAVTVPNVGTFYVRTLWSFDSGPSSTYTALKGTSSTGGKTFYILFNCGNLVTIGAPVPVPQPKPAPTPTPGFTVTKGVKAKNQSVYYKSVTAKPGDTVDFAIGLTNTGNTNLNTIIKDTLPAGLTAVPGSLATDGKPVVALIANYNTGEIKPGQYKRVTFSAKVGTPATDCTIYTNKVSAQAGNLPVKEDTANVRTCKPTVPPPPAPTPTPVVTPVVTPTAPPAPCAYNTNLPADSPDCKPCEESVSSTDSLACLQRRKAAANLSQNLTDANNTTAQANDQIVYTLYAENKGKATIEDYIFQDSLSDVLDYADVTDVYGGRITDDKSAIWPAVDIKPGETASVRVAVKVKAEIPTTPQVAGTGHYDHIMTNVFANAVNISLPQAPVVQVQTVANTLPVTGPGTNMAIAALVVMSAGYFLARARLLAYETNIAIRDNNSGGF